MAIFVVLVMLCLRIFKCRETDRNSPPLECVLWRPSHSIQRRSSSIGGEENGLTSRGPQRDLPTGWNVGWYPVYPGAEGIGAPGASEAPTYRCLAVDMEDWDQDRPGTTRRARIQGGTLVSVCQQQVGGQGFQSTAH